MTRHTVERVHSTYRQRIKATQCVVMHNLSPEESQVAKTCPVLAYRRRSHECVGHVGRAKGCDQNLGGSYYLNFLKEMSE